ncbi:MAG: IS1 family transposase [Chloroflexota bacterium]|nr:IS1 family transposase [Chloroflexota bacterium]
MRSISRITGVSINTVTKLLVDAGEACARYSDRRIKGIESKRIQCDEIWSFCYAKEDRKVSPSAPADHGNVWTWTAIDADTKMILSWMVSPDRGSQYATEFMNDLRSRVVGKPQVSTDGWNSYITGVEEAFGSEVRYGQLIKVIPDRGIPEGEPRYVSPDQEASRRVAVSGDPYLDDISTSYVERQNLTMRMSMKRFARLSNGFSKKLENHVHMLSLYFTWYNFCRAHSSLGKPYKGLGVTPAMAAGLTERPYTLEGMIRLIDNR